MSADRHLLFGLLALQNEFINKRQLVVAFGEWMADRSLSLDEILRKHQAISDDLQSLLNRLVDQHVQARGGDIHASLQSISGVGSVREELERLSDTEIHASICHLKAADPYATVTVGQSTSHGGRFEIRRPLDRGGLGIVSVAFDKELSREVALKEIRTDCADDDRFRQKFLLEAEVTGGLEHPSIVPVYGLGSYADGRPYYAMRLIKGDNLKGHIKQFHQNVERGSESFDGAGLRKLLRRFLDVCEAIDYAHARGVLHRDLKPGNVMLGKYGETLVVDWGLAKVRVSKKDASEEAIAEVTIPLNSEAPLIPSGSAQDETRQGSIIGTAAYAPPEQLTGDIRNTDVRADVYGLGAVLYELLTGRAPGVGNTLEEVMKNVVRGNVPSPRSIQARIPRPLEAICLKAIATNPLHRYSKASLLRDETERWLDDLPVSAYPEPMLQRTKRWIKSHQLVMSVSGAILVMTTIGFGTILILNRQYTQQLQAKDLALRVTAKALEAKGLEMAEKESELKEVASKLMDEKKMLQMQNQVSEMERMKAQKAMEAEAVAREQIEAMKPK